MLYIISTIISYDVWFYISHLLLHTKTLWFIHKEHHTRFEPVYYDAYVGHYLESPFQSIGFLVPFAFFPLDVQQVILVLIYLNARGMMRHDSRFAFIVGEHHIDHHRYGNCNYSEWWIDALCGTLKKDSKSNNKCPAPTQTSLESLERDLMQPDSLVSQS